MNKSIILLVCVAFFAVVYAVDVTIVGGDSFGGEDSTSSTNAAGVTAGAALSSVSFTAIPSDPNVAIYYPGSATKATIGSVSNGATGWGGFQVVGPAGGYSLTIAVLYKKSNTWYSFNGTFPLIIYGGDTGTVGKRIVTEKDEVSVSSVNGNSDLSVDPSDGWVAEESTSTWQLIEVKSKGPALSSVTFSIKPQAGGIAISYHEKTGNVIGNIAANGVGRSNFQMTADAGLHYLDVKISYRKSGVSYSHTEVLKVVAGGDNGTVGKRLIVSIADKALPAQMNMTVVGLAVGGIALIAIVAVVVVVAVVRRQKTVIVA